MKTRGTRRRLTCSGPSMTVTTVGGSLGRSIAPSFSRVRWSVPREGVGEGH